MVPDIFKSGMVFDRKQITALVLLDLSKAFDNIYHKILLSKLRVLDVFREAIEWFRSYLSDRTQCVRIGHEVSDPSVKRLCSLKSYEGLSGVLGNKGT